MWQKALACLFLVQIAACSPQSNEISTDHTAIETSQTVAIETRLIELTSCSLYELVSDTRILLYEFDTTNPCYLMEDADGVRVFDTESGTAIPLGISIESESHCETYAYAILFKENSFHLSNQYYSDFRCKNDVWHEKQFHVLVSNVTKLPSTQIDFRQTY